MIKSQCFKCALVALLVLASMSVQGHHFDDLLPSLWRRRNIRFLDDQWLSEPANVSRLATKRSNEFMLSPISQQAIALGPYLEKVKLKLMLSARSSLDKMQGDQCSPSSSLVLIEQAQQISQDASSSRICRATIRLNRCDGYCISGVHPSINSATGVIKTCRCCNELKLEKRIVRLGQCYAAIDGSLLTGPNSFMDVQVEEPVGCKCRPCSNGLRI